MSHLLQMRGLKLETAIKGFNECLSHLLQMRGLKQYITGFDLDKMPVASFTDAWIETCHTQTIEIQIRSHLLQMRGLKREKGCREFHPYESHLLQMRGLKLDSDNSSVISLSRIFYRCVD